MILFKEHNQKIIFIAQMAIIKTSNCGCNSQDNMKIVIITKFSNVILKIKKESFVKVTLRKF